MHPETAAPTLVADRLAQDVLAGLASHPRTLPCRYFYDDTGCELYDQITELPEYYLTRTETALLTRVAPEIADRVGQREIAELGAGSGAKALILLAAFKDRGWDLHYRPLDASSAMLDLACGLKARFPTLRVDPVLGDHQEALASLPCAPRLLLFLGSTIGNLIDPEIAALAKAIHASLAPGGAFLLGFDRQAHATKPASLIEAAYDDSSGITAAFNRNLLARLNRELGADFDLAAFVHEACYNAQEHRIEMWLRSTRRQTVSLPALDRAFVLEAGEGILTEISRKFAAADLAERFAPLELTESWTDDRQLCDLLLFERARE